MGRFRFSAAVLTGLMSLSGFAQAKGPVMVPWTFDVTTYPLKDSRTMSCTPDDVYPWFADIRDNKKGSELFVVDDATKIIGNSVSHEMPQAFFVSYVPSHRGLAKLINVDGTVTAQTPTQEDDKLSSYGQYLDLCTAQNHQNLNALEGTGLKPVGLGRPAKITVWLPKEIKLRKAVNAPQP